MKNLFLVLFLILISLFFQAPALAQDAPPDEMLEAKVVNILEEKNIQVMDKTQLYQRLSLLVTKGSLTGQKIVVENGNVPVVNQQRYRLNDEVILNASQDIDGNRVFYITDSIRRRPLFILVVIFVILAVFIARWRGLASLLGMVISFLVIIRFILPQISAGSDPLMTAIIGSLIIIPVTFYLSHGINQKTTIAIVGTVITLIITGILSVIFVSAARLTGFASEEAGFVQAAKQGLVSIQGLLLAGILIGALGVLDDVSISQASIVRQLKQANPHLNRRELYLRANDVGQDHIASMINTLILVYAGASLPLLLLFSDNPRPFTEIINYELIAEEIVRTLVGSIGLMLTVPVTTLIATLWEHRS